MTKFKIDDDKIISQNFRTQIDWKATFQSKNAPRAAVYFKKASKFVFYRFIRGLRAVQMYLEGHMRLASCVFETPVLSG